MKRQPQITEKTRQKFVEVFCELYSQKPIEKISVQEIANRSGYNRSTFYQYFTDIYELLDSVENDLLNDIKKEITLGQIELNVPQNHSLTPYLIEFYLTTSLSLFRLWLQRQKDLSSEEFFKLVENLYSRGITPYFKE